MKIKTIEIRDYKAFLGTHKIPVGGKNLFVYGENGSGKSSLYYALKDFFQSSIEDIDLPALENIFVKSYNNTNHSCKTQIKVTFKPGKDGGRRQANYVFSASANDTRADADASIRDGNKLKSFLTYKHLLGIHNLKQEDNINLFDLLVKGVLRHFKNALTNGKELFELFEDIQEILGKKTDRQYDIRKKKADASKAVKTFNTAFQQLFDDGGPEDIHTHARPILQKFGHNVDFTLKFSQLTLNEDFTGIMGDTVSVDLTYAGREVTKPHMFLNEARLSAIAISIYLGMIKRHPQQIFYKVLFLDDVFIGLDISNRMPLLQILEEDFPDYQVFITTYDKPWFELAKGHLEKSGKWNTLELYAGYNKAGYSTPLIIGQHDLLARANTHLRNRDYKSAAVYTRSAFEKYLRKACEKKGKKIAFKSKLKDYSSEDFWKVIKSNLDAAIVTDIELYRSLVLNPFSHYNSEKHEIRTELENAIEAVTRLKEALHAL